ncbi:MAG TPA: hypothetical protein VMG12_44285 [Polyangiaceae bacterium]|nr:hypothetical protein [Polyangiaceae bacterium]
MTRTIARAWACRATLALAVLCHLTGSARAQTPDADAREADVESAEARAARAYEAYAAKDYENAIRLYLEAYEAASDPDILYNIARVYETGLQDRVQAMTFYRDFIANPNANPERVEQATIRLRALEAEESAEAVPEVAPAANEAAAPPPANPAPILAPAPSASPRAPTPAPSAPDGGWSGWRTGALVTGGAGLVALGVGAVFGLEALSDAKTARRECDGNRCFTERGLAAARNAGEAADVATLSFAAGGVLLAAGATLLGIDLGRSEEPGQPASAHWTAAVTTADVRIGLRGAW